MTVKMRLRSFLLNVLLLLLTAFAASAQPVAAQPEMADALRQDAKFWVVVTVIAVVTLGMFVYLIRLDGKVRKLEDRVRDQAS